jgi:hypothetical protein
MVAPAVAAGARPLYYPINSAGRPALEALNSFDTAGVRAILVAHLFGFHQSLAEVRAFCNARGIALIEDCAHALFGEIDGHTVGNLGDVAIGSLTKFFPVPEGGCLVSTRHALSGIALGPRGIMAEVKALANILEVSVDHDRLGGLNKPLAFAFRLKKIFSRVGPHSPGGADSPPTSESELLTRLDRPEDQQQLARICRWIVHRAGRERIVNERRNNYAYLLERFARFPGARPLFPELPPAVVPYVFPLWVDDPQPRYALLKAERFPVFRWDWLWPGTPSIPGDYGTLWSKHVFQLPCHQDLSREHLDTLVERLAGIFKKADR